jgi:cytoskeletal protein CcmA (bactofilin family)
MADETPAKPTPSESKENASGNPPEGLSLDGDTSGGSGGPGSTTVTPGAQKNAATPKKKQNPLKRFLARFSVYLLLFFFVMIISFMVVVVSYLHGKTKTPAAVTSQTLSQNSLKQLSGSDVTVGDVKQTLNVQSNAVFAGQVLIQKDLEVAGKLHVGGTLALTGLTVSGSTVLDSAQVNKNLTIAGDTAMQGGLSLAKGLNVNGSASFSGAISAPQITASTLQLNGDLVLTHHIVAGGANPGRTPGTGLGSGGTASVSGSDTAGSITINTGGGPGAGCLVTVNFTQKFNSTPHVIVTPIEAAAANLGYYVTRSTSSFTVCVANAPGAGQSFGFDYIVLD